VTNHEDAYSAGARSAQQAIADGFPRWAHLSDRPIGQFIDPDTGLPLIGFSGAPELADFNTALVRGYNDTISAGIESGDVTVDFRPLLMPHHEVLSALRVSHLGTLSMDNPRVEGPDGTFVLRLRPPKQNAKRSLTWISYCRADEEWPNFALYEVPIEVALGRSGRVLIFRSQCAICTRDAETTQVLNTYPF